MYQLTLKDKRSISDYVSTRRGQPRIKGRSAVSLGQLNKLVTEKVLKDTFQTFSYGTDLASLMRGKRSNNSFDLGSEEGLRDAYERSLERAGKLNHALSRAQMESNENQVLFRKAVDLGEQLKRENQELEDKLDDQLDMVSFLQRELKMTKESYLILAEELEEMKLAEKKAENLRVELTKSNNLAKEELHKQKILLQRIETDHENARNSWDVNKQEAFDKLVQELKDEKASWHEENALRKVAEENLRITKMQLEESEKKVNLLKQNVDELATKLEDETDRLNQECVRLVSEKAFLDMKNELLIRDYKTLDNQLKEATEHLLPSVEEAGMWTGPSLAEQVDFMSRGASIRSVISAVSLLDGNIDDDSPTADASLSGPPPLSEIFKNYLYITATAIKLHFPDIDSVKTETLIDHVKSSPFYLYYDLMMNYMHEIMQEKAVDDVKKSVLSPSRKEQTSLLARFKLLSMGRKSTKTKQDSALNLSSIFSYSGRISQNQTSDRAFLDSDSKINKPGNFLSSERIDKYMGSDRGSSTQFRI